jgi:hypothetical protein
MSYSEQIRHPDGALNPPQQKKSSIGWWWFIFAGIVALILVAIFRPQWLEKIGIHIARGGGGMLPPANPMGWV